MDTNTILFLLEGIHQEGVAIVLEEVQCLAINDDFPNLLFGPVAFLHTIM